MVADDGTHVYGGTNFFSSGVTITSSTSTATQGWQLSGTVTTIGIAQQYGITEYGSTFTEYGFGEPLVGVQSQANYVSPAITGESFTISSPMALEGSIDLVTGLTAEPGMSPVDPAPSPTDAENFDTSLNAPDAFPSQDPADNVAPVPEETTPTEEVDPGFGI